MRLTFMRSVTAIYVSLALSAAGAGVVAQSTTPPVTATAVQPPSPAVLTKLYELGLLAVKPDAPQARAMAGSAYARWRNETSRTEVKPMVQPLSAQEVIALLAQPMPAAYGAVSGQTMGIFGKASKQPTRDAAEAAAKADCLAKGGPKCDSVQIVVGSKCLGFTGFSTKGSTTVVSTFGADPAAASAGAMASCRKELDAGNLCTSLVVVCADGRPAG
jgi:hypothetical protein